MAVDLGTLSITLGADTGQLKLSLGDASKALDKHAKDADRALQKMAGEFSRTFGGLAPRVAESMSKIGDAIEKTFGENATGPAMKLGKVITGLTGISETTFTKMGAGLKALQPLFGLVAAAAGLISAPLVAALVVLTSLVAVYGTLRKVIPDNPLAGVGGKGVDWNRPAPGPKTAGQFYDPQTGKYSAAPVPVAEHTPSNVAGGVADDAGKLLGAVVKDVAEALKSGMAGIDDAMKAAGVDLSSVFEGGAGKKDLESAAAKRFAAFNKSEDMRSAAMEKAANAEVKRLKENAAALGELGPGGAGRIQRGGASGMSIGPLLSEMGLAVDQVTSGLMTAREASEEFGVSLGDLKKSTDKKAAEDRTYRAGGSSVTAGTGGAAVGNSLMGKIGGISGEVIQGFQSGGLPGALAALLAGSKGFAQIVESLNIVVQMVSDTLGQVFSAIEPLLIALQPLVTIIMTALSPVFEVLRAVLEPFAVLIAALVPIFGAIGPLLQILIQTTLLPFLPVIWSLKTTMVVLLPVIGALSWVVLKLVEGISWVWNTILDAVVWLIKGIGEAVGSVPFLGGLGDAIKSFGDDLESMKVNMESIKAGEQAAVDMMTGAVDYDALAASTKRQTEATDKQTEATTRATEALTNVPQGYKVALTRFNATLGSGQSEYLPALAEGGIVTRPTVALIGEAGPEAVVPLGKGGTGGTVNVTIVSNDARRLWEEIKRLAQRDNFTLNGSMVPAGIR